MRILGLFGNQSYCDGTDAQDEWEEDHGNASDLPDSVIRHIARQQGKDEQEFLEGWRDGEKFDYVYNKWRLF